MEDHTTDRDDLPDAEALPAPELTTRRAAIDDYSTIRHVHASAVRSLGDKLLDAAEVAAATQAIYSGDYTAELLRKSVFVAVLNGAIVGTCAWSPNDDRGTSARISSLFIAPLSQGSGYGRRLLREVERDARQNGFERFALTAPVAIVSLFTGAGFTVASYGTSRDVIPDTAVQVVFLRKPE